MKARHSLPAVLLVFVPIMPVAVSATVAIAMAVAVTAVVIAAITSTSTATATAASTTTFAPIASRVIVSVVLPDGNEPKAGQHAGRSFIGPSIHRLDSGVPAQTDRSAQAAGIVGNRRAELKGTAVHPSIEAKDDGHSGHRQP
jgi:hypothetical protein